MRRKLAACLISIAILAMVSGCAMSPAKQEGTLIGAGAGALVGAGIGCGVAATQNGGNDNLAYETGSPVGFVGGAINGGPIGYFLAQEPPAPPLPPPPPPPPPPPAPPPAQER